jgi:hypothetical protein
MYGLNLSPRLFLGRTAPPCGIWSRGRRWLDTEFLKSPRSSICMQCGCQGSTIRLGPVVVRSAVTARTWRGPGQCGLRRCRARAACIEPPAPYDALMLIVDYAFPVRRRASACCSRTAPMNTCNPGTVSFPSSSIRSRRRRPEMVSGFWCRSEPPPNNLVSRRCSSLVSWLQCVVAGISRLPSDSRRNTKRDWDSGYFAATA